MIRPLTALRFFAALAVFVSHAGWSERFGSRFILGHVGVAFFFMLSGFVLFHSYGGAFPVRQFYVARFARLFPLHVVGIIFAVLSLAGVGTAPIWNHISWEQRLIAILLQLAFLQSWFPQEWIHFGMNAPAWSLSDEMFFYFAFPFLAGIISRYLAMGLSRLVGSILMLWVIQAVMHISRLGQLHHSTLYIFPPLRLTDFVVGMLLAAIFGRLSIKTTNAAKWSALESLAILYVLASIFIAGDGQAYFEEAFPISFAMVLIIFSFQRGFISHLLAGRFLCRLGEASFAFYLIHVSVIRVCEFLLGGSPTAFTIALAISLALALWLNRYVEMPLKDTLRSFFIRCSLTFPFIQHKEREATSHLI